MKFHYTEFIHELRKNQNIHCSTNHTISNQKYVKKTNINFSFFSYIHELLICSGIYYFGEADAQSLQKYFITAHFKSHNGIVSVNVFFGKSFLKYQCHPWETLMIFQWIKFPQVKYWKMRLLTHNQNMNTSATIAASTTRQYSWCTW